MQIAEFKQIIIEAGLEDDLELLKLSLEEAEIDETRFWEELAKLVKQAKEELNTDFRLKKFELTESQASNWQRRKITTVHSPSELPDLSEIDSILEPWANVKILVPEEYVGSVIELITDRRGSYVGMQLLAGTQIELKGVLPLAEMIIDFYDDLKSATKGYATLSYELAKLKPAKLVKIDLLVNGKVVDPLSFLTDKSQADSKARQVCARLKELIPRQQIEIAIQAAIGSRIIARETIKAFRKDVTAKLYGGDPTRRKKLLEKQKKGKKRMKMVGNVEIPQSAFLNVLKKN